MVLNVISRSLYTALLLMMGTLHVVHAEDISLLPKYGEAIKSPAQLDADAKFLSVVDEQYKGDRSSAATDFAHVGWDALHAGEVKKAMRRFNEAWLLDHQNLYALWGMAVMATTSGQYGSAHKLFVEADAQSHGDPAFITDYARGLSMIATQTHDPKLLKDAFKRFAAIYSQNPQQVPNLQNWAIALFATGDYPAAWQKIQLAEAAPDHALLDQNFIAALSSKMARPVAKS